ncbi:type VI secretion system membrane subunit TssM [Paraburkholderia sp. MMS20-SJTR3]|uniref:Type VI secretion system membrane subunit TssM n=1 Tax=Paraburkholderia sejongensis TaxID=2886946 RepID=A0ABS8K0S5_9BURK|nr:type VI secretion system membrane subunit TssM [Paraburkholderia sp. MMS20-SJTR3]MCC8395688.1 type VI secretion system membrane subunit TssM [Paraburkholderia sp. MMS20-SJTR3]
MSFLNRFWKLIISRQALVFAAILVAAAAIWFIGPLIAFGDYQPLESILSRTLAIVILLALLLFLLLNWSPAPIGVALLALALWYFGPLLAFGDAHPFGASWSRVLAISLLLAGYAIYRLYRLWQTVRGDEVMLQRVLHPFGSKAKDANSAPPAGRAAIRDLNSVVAKAIDKLKRLRGGPAGVRRLLESQRYLYELPWYMVVGSPGAGKTTLVLNSGLDFPDADQMVATSLSQRVQTKNCDWWFANEAVLIDTAGRYTVHDAAAGPSDDGATAAERQLTNGQEWQGFLALLRKRRPRAPINGALLVVSAEELLSCAASERTALAASLRARLSELRQQLGIRFPVYVLVTKLDLLPGFGEYFQSLTAESRAQILGFTLPYRDDDEEHSRDALRLTCAAELRELERGLEDGINTRLQEVYEVDRRKKLYALPSEFRSLGAELTELLALVFLDSKYDDAQLNSTLRGVYFTSAAQTHEVVPADRSTLLQRLRRGLAGLFGGESKAGLSSSAFASGQEGPTAYRGYFLRNLFQRVILAEGHLVRPNLYWEIRFRALRVVGHLLAIVAAVWLLGGLIVSYGNNREYLAAIDKKSDALAARVGALRKAPQPGSTGPILSASRDLPQFRDVDLNSPGLSWRYGLYSAPAVSSAADETYARLLRQMLLPQIVGRFETALDTQLGAQDADGVYRTLSVYLMLFDRSHYDAKAIKAWVLNDWEQTNSAASLGERSVMARHLDALFAAGVPATPATPMNAPLVARARDFLGRNPAAGRLYERAMQAMAAEAPENVTLLSAAGPQALTVFKLVDGSTLERGIPGLYTYDGYHEVFNKRLPEFLAQAQKEDTWVMGEAGATSRWRAVATGDALRARNDRLADDIRRQFLTDYGNHWQQFLDEIRPASGSRGTFSADLQTLRALAAPDSPLARLARTAVRETSLSAAAGADEPAVTDGAMKLLTSRSRVARAASAVAAATAFGQLTQQKMERELVDSRFDALREVVTGQAGIVTASASGPASAAQPAPVSSSALRLDAVIGLINEQYTRVVMAGNVLATNTMPAVDDLGATLQLEAEKLPAPFRAVLAGLASQSMNKVDRGVGSLLTLQVESSVGGECRRAIEGKYPFAAGGQDVDIDDFNRVFAAGGLLDDFFQKTLASRVDTSIRPWRYKSVSPGMPPMRGPSLEPFERAAAIRQTFFRDPGANRMAWKMGLKVVSLDPEITDLTIDIDGQSLRYAHGPVTTYPITWPGPRGGSMAGITANPRVRPDTSTLMAEGPWALFRLIDRGHTSSTLSASRSAVDFNFDDRHAVLEMTSGSHSGPQLIALLRGFRCPGRAGSTAERAPVTAGGLTDVAG